MLLLYIQAPMQQAIPPPGVQGQYGPAPGSGYPPQGYPQPQNTGVNPQGGYPMTVTPSALQACARQSSALLWGCHCVALYVLPTETEVTASRV